jgi:hypothetical protein
MALCSGASTALSPPVQQDVKLALAAPAVSSGLRRSRVLFDLSPSSVPSREGHERSTAGPCQVSKRSAETRAHRPAGSRFIRGRFVAFCSPSADQAGAACCPGAVSPKRCPDISSVLTTARGSQWAMRRPDPRPASDLPGALTGSSPRTGGPSKSRSKRFGEPPASASPPPAIRPNAPPGRAHDRGRCPLYVRAQPETAGLPWT